MQILLVDDEPAVLRALGSVLRRAGHAAHTAQSLAAARRVLQEQQAIDVVVSDVDMDGESGADFVANLHGNDPSGTYLLMTGNSEYEAPAPLRDAIRVLYKPISAALLLAALGLSGKVPNDHRR